MHIYIYININFIDFFYKIKPSNNFPLSMHCLSAFSICRMWNIFTLCVEQGLRKSAFSKISIYYNIEAKLR